MTILILSSLLIIGLILLLIEIIFIPGTTVVGIFGLAVSVAGVVYAFVAFDSEVALGITAFTVAVNFASIWYGFSSGVWRRFSLKTSMKGGAFDGRTDGVLSLIHI